jgi:hypothetical protein
VVSSADHAAHAKPTLLARTSANMSMGTPAYMSPEQSEDASKVDQRADIYSLGCTLYDLLTGRPPFLGRTAMEVITKHQREAVVPPDHVAKNVPRSLSAVLLKMVAKRPEQRYASMGEVIRELEDFLGVATTGPFTPKEEHVRALELSAERFNTSAWARARKLTIGAFYLLCAGLAIFVGSTRETVTDTAQFAGGFVGLAVIATLAYFVITGFTERTHLFKKLRQLAFGANLTDILVWTLGLFAACAVLVIFDQHWPWLIVSGIAVMLALGFHFTIDLALKRDRAQSLEQVESMLKSMRLRGLEENALRQFVCKSSGNHWEEFYEALFGYEDKICARSLWGRGERGRERPRHGAWRDPIVRAIENRISLRREIRERQLLARVEAKALRAKGIRDDLARKQARRSARELVRRAGKLRSASTTAMRHALTALPSGAARSIVKSGNGHLYGPNVTVQITRDVALESAIAQILTGADDRAAMGRAGAGLQSTDEEYERLHESWFKRRFGTPADFIFGPFVRLLMAAIVLTCFTVWWKQNSGARAAREAMGVLESKREIPIGGQLDDWTRAGQAAVEDAQRAAEIAARVSDKPLRLFPGSEVLGGWNAGLAGLLLLLSVFFTGRVMAALVIGAALIAMVGHRFSLPILQQPAQAWMSATAGALLWVFGVIFFRQREGY